MPGVTGGALPARIWKDFMSQALGERSAPSRPRPSPNPSGPVEPQDVGDIPLGENASLQIGQEGATISGQIEGVPVNVQIDGNGVRVEPGARNREQEVPVEAPTPRPGQ